MILGLTWAPSVNLLIFSGPWLVSDPDPLNDDFVTIYTLYPMSYPTSLKKEARHLKISSFDLQTYL